MTSTADPPRIVALKGALTLANAESTKAALLAGLDAGAIMLDCSDVEDVDVTGVQLLLAACRSAAARDNAFGLAAPLPAFLAETFERCGLPASSLENMEESR
jgi:anti-anti-sigma regulatory factor